MSDSDITVQTSQGSTSQGSTSQKATSQSSTSQKSSSQKTTSQKATSQSFSYKEIVDPEKSLVVDVEELMFYSGFLIFQIEGTHYDRIDALIEEFPQIIEADYYLIPMNSGDRPTPNLYYALIDTLLDFHPKGIKIINKRRWFDYESGPFMGEIIDTKLFISQMIEPSIKGIQKSFDSEGVDYVLFLTSDKYTSIDKKVDELFPEGFRTYQQTLHDHKFYTSDSEWSWLARALTIIIPWTEYSAGSTFPNNSMSKLNLVIGPKNHYGVIIAVIINGLSIRENTRVLCEYCGQFTVM